MAVIVETFHQLMARYSDGEEVEDGMVVETSLSRVLAGGADPLRLVGYLRSLSLPIEGLDDLLLVNELSDEEEVSAYRVTEGVALTIASQGAWALFRP